MELEVAVLRETQHWTTFRLKEELVIKQVLKSVSTFILQHRFLSPCSPPHELLMLRHAKRLITRQPLNWLNRYKTCAGYYDENRIIPIEAILKHKQVVCMRSKLLLTVRKYLFLFQRYPSFKNMPISSAMTSFNQPSFDQIWWKKISQPICIRNLWFFAGRVY